MDVIFVQSIILKKGENTVNETLTFEEAMDQLELIVGRLEEGDIPLEEALEFTRKGWNYQTLS